MVFYFLTILLGKVSSIWENYNGNSVGSVFTPEIFVLLSLRLQTVKGLAKRLSHPLSSKSLKILTLFSFKYRTTVSHLLLVLIPKSFFSILTYSNSKAS